ncbi:hypothetical protein PENTCL1PPCAC_12059, partial [Pristionchus entomophagus]
MQETEMMKHAAFSIAILSPAETFPVHTSSPKDESGEHSTFLTTYRLLAMRMRPGAHLSVPEHRAVISPWAMKTCSQSEHFVAFGACVHALHSLNWSGRLALTSTGSSSLPREKGARERRRRGRR